MDFRRRFLIRADHLASRFRKAGPAFLRGRLAVELEQAVREYSEKPRFMRFVDSFQARLYAELLATYRDEPFCQILALKLANLAVAKYHFLHRHSVLVSRPLQLTVDPTNACQLACPGCVHTDNVLLKPHVDWPLRTLTLEVFESFLARTGPFAFCEMLYNYGEPLLHKRFTDFVRAAKRYLLFTMTSTNLSMPLRDHEAIVASGLDRMVVSIDGTTQEVYSKYRRKGNLELVFDNLRKIVRAKKAMGSRTPYLIWQFLTFAHNAHQVNDAISKAREFGLNEILVATPFAVAHDDPEIQAVELSSRGTYTFERWDGRWYSGHLEIDPNAACEFRQTWEQRCLNLTAFAGESQSQVPTCDWLYHNLSIDGAGRLMPCCMAPDRLGRNLVFDNFDAGDPGQDVVNSRMAMLARLSFSDRGQYERQAQSTPEQIRPYCASCSEAPQSAYGLANIAGDIRTLDSRAVIRRSLKWELTHWK